MALQVMCVLVAWLVGGLAVGMVIGRAADFGDRPGAYGRVVRRSPSSDR